ncbi:SKIP/SNW domain-containing protein [Cladochytrium replicatum]|nr:SKIP/SNW domain-containing protein [Cladochytrium replicatum]
MSLSSVLPKPKSAFGTAFHSAPANTVQPRNTSAITRRGPPPYGHRQGFVPRTQEDFGNGGAYPEIFVAQYPLDMGRKKTVPKTGSVLPLKTDAEGKVRYDLVVKQGDPTRKVQSQLNDLVPIDVAGEEDWQRPGEDAVKETMERTQAALEKLVDGKIKSAQPKGAVEKQNAPKYIRYQPQQSGATAGIGTRIIKIVEAPVDPFEPPRFKHKKVARSAPSPPPPVMHSPPRKVTAEEQKDWVIPPCISNWKNAKGYTIPLDKRLAADGRGNQDIVINDNFAKFSESLFIAERHAREEVRIRAELQAKLASKEKKEKEELLRKHAQQARDQRSGLGAFGGGGGAAVPVGGAAGGESGSEDEESLDEGDLQRLKEREELRREKQKQREREMRMSHMGAETKAKVLAKTGERDISEKIALGLAKPTLSKDSMFDQRLFNRSEGIGSGFADDDANAFYDKPLFSGSSANAIYRPRIKETEHLHNVSAERIESIVSGAEGGRGMKAFAGGSEGGSSSAQRSGPVQFEKDDTDVFGLEEFVSKTKRGRDLDDAPSSSKRSRGD